MSRPADPKAPMALIAAARREFAGHGLRGARIEDITAACNLSKGAFYLHFESKEALFGQVVDGFLSGLRKAGDARDRLYDRLARAGGPITTAELRRGTSRAREFLAEELKLDASVLDLMWEYRDVVDVLIRGSQGTPFEGLMWQVVDAEVVRITEQFERHAGPGSDAADDLPPDLVGSLIVGTYLLLAKRMVGLTAKPEMRAWARPLQRLLYEGSPLPSKTASALPPARARRDPRTSVSRRPPRTEP